MCIIYVEFYDKINFGDDMFVRLLCGQFPEAHFITVAQSRYKDIFSDIENLSVYSYDNGIIPKAYNKIVNCRRRKIKKADICVYIGGSVFMETGDVSARLKNDVKRVNDAKHMFYISSNFGPYKSEEFKKAYEEIFKKCDGVCFRDKYSYDLFKHLDVVSYAPDAVFSADIGEVKNEGYAVIAPGYIPDDTEYDNKILSYIRLADAVIDAGYPVRLVSSCGYEGTHDTVEKIFNAVKNKTMVSKYLYEGNYKEFIRIIKNSSLVMTGRFHAAIIALLADKKIINLGCEKLDRAVGGLCNMDSDDMKNIRSLDLLQKYDKIVTIDTRNFCNNASKQFKKLNTFIKKVDKNNK